MLRVTHFLTFTSSSSSHLKRLKPHHHSTFSFLLKPFSVATATALVPVIFSTTYKCNRSLRTSSVRCDSRPETNVVSFQSQKKVRFCQSCGATMTQGVPDGDDKLRSICTMCGKVAYENPKMVVGCLVEHENKVLLVRRSIQPAYGLWTLPAGFMEIGESTVQGAIRETWEEAGAEVEVVSPFIHMDVPLIGHTYMLFRAKLKTPHFAPGPESLDCKLFTVEDIPFDSLAFSSILVALNLYTRDLKAGKPKFHYCIINKRAGAASSDLNSHTVDNYMEC